MAEKFKDLFLTYNKPWLKENIQEVFTPRTLFQHRETIAAEFRKILGPLEPELSTDHEVDKGRTIKEMAAAVDREESDGTPLNTSEREAMREQGIDVDEELGKVVRAKLKAERAREQQAYVDHVRSQATPAVTLIVKYWLQRTRFLRKLRTQVGIYIKNQLESECQFCGNIYGLNVELIESLEDVFFEYLAKSGRTVGNYVWDEWFFYFKRNTTYRTLCGDCADELAAHYQIYRKKVRRREKI